MAIAVTFCERCGYLKGALNNSRICPCCGYTLIDSELSFESFMALSDDELYRYSEAHLDPSVSTSEYFRKYKAWNEALSAKIDREHAEFNRDHPECPYCHTRNTKRISTSSRLLSVGLFGLGSKKIGKQWHCDNCNSDF